MIWWVLFSSLLVVALIVMYGKLHSARNKGGRIDMLEGRIAALSGLLKRKNAYIETLEKSLLESASPERVVDTLNGLFADEDSIPAGAGLYHDGPAEEASHEVGSRIGFKGPAGD